MITLALLVLAAALVITGSAMLGGLGGALLATGVVFALAVIDVARSDQRGEE